MIPTLPPFIFKSEEVSLAVVDEVLLKKDYETILKDSNLFWAIFCKAVSIKAQDKVYYPPYPFLVSPQGMNLTVTSYHNEETGHDPLLGIKRCVEEIRTIFLRAFNERKKVKCISQKNERGGDFPFVGLSAFFKDIRQPFHYVRIEELYARTYKHSIKPYLEKLSELLKADYQDLKEKYQKKLCNSPLKQPFWVGAKSTPFAFQIRWKWSDEKTPKRKELCNHLFSLYKNETLCDLALLANDNTKIGVHSSMLLLFGGEMMEKLLTSNFKEKQEMIIHFPFSSEVIRIFADFIYLGPDGLLREEALHPKFSQTVELFKLGHLYHIPSLVEFCTYLFQRQVTEKDIAKIKELAESYESPELHSIYSKLRNSKFE